MTNISRMSDDQKEELEAFYLQTSASLEILERDLAIYQANPDAKIYRLEKALSCLEKAKSIPLEIQKPNQISKVATYLQQAQYIASLNILEVDVLDSMNLDGFRVGQHKRDASSRVSCLWVAKISPSFHPPAILSIVISDKQILGAFGASISEFGLKYSYHTKRLDETWLDKVSKLLRNSDLLDTEGATFSLDGIGYHLDAVTFSTKTTIEFSNPITHWLSALEKALLNVGEEILTSSVDEPLKDYLKIWRGYIRD